MTATLAHLRPELRRWIREAALIGAPYPLFDDSFSVVGPPVLPITPRHHLMLQNYRNPCWVGGKRTVAAVLQYLWLCSPEFRALDRAGFNAGFAARVRSLRFRLFRLRWRRSVAFWGAPRAKALEGVANHAECFLLDRPAVPVERSARRALTPDGVRDAPHELISLEAVCRRYLHYTRDEFWHTPYVTTNGLLSMQFSPGPGNDVPKFDRARDKILGERCRARRAAWLAAKAQSEARS